MRIYRFRVLLDDASEAFRDIEIGSEQNLKVFHQAIQDAFGFSGNEMACFYVSDEEWNKGTEIPLADLGFGEEGTPPPALMDQVLLSDHIRSTDQRFLYVYDFLHMWVFMVELIGAGSPVKGVEYPRVVMRYGTPPAENSRMDAALLPPLEDDSYAEDTAEVYDPDEDLGFGDDDDDPGHEGDDDGLSGHEPLPDEYH
ncbi:MAG: hypothetical protein IT228_13385 [Flavobacteriales bacterium]|nr:hypothetical protein [Flavobacteriales bacterium]MCC6578327.1 hypothetical protein [Flavobacteriales bacterium]NUQ15767.1 hypothetical protein [Flavobacteriales bacterium]